MSNLHKLHSPFRRWQCLLASLQHADGQTVEEFQAMPLAYPKFMVDNLWILHFCSSFLLCTSVLPRWKPDLPDRKTL